MRVITERELAIPRRNEIENEINFYSILYTCILYCVCVCIYIYFFFIFVFYRLIYFILVGDSPLAGKLTELLFQMLHQMIWKRARNAG